MTKKEMDDYLKGLRERAQEFGTEREQAVTRGLDLIQAKEVGMLERDEDEDEG